jgi:cell pole-organizing protein PopZ
MSDESKQEPTMEEILASIRRIISEDDGENSEDAPEEAGFSSPVETIDSGDRDEPEFPPPPEPELEPEREPEVEVEEDVLDLTDRVDPVGDIEPLRPQPALVSDPTAAAAAAAFGHLSASLLMPQDFRTLEDVVRELLRPLLKQWLDNHLPEIVEAQVQAEIERISRSGRVR